MLLIRHARPPVAVRRLTLNVSLLPPWIAVPLSIGRFALRWVGRIVWQVLEDIGLFWPLMLLTYGTGLLAGKGWAVITHEGQPWPMRVAGYFVLSYPVLIAILKTRQRTLRAERGAGRGNGPKRRGERE